MDQKTNTTPEAVAPPLGQIDIERIKADFPILEQKIGDNRLVYLDNAATTQKPRTVINALLEFYRKYNANIHRGLHYLSEKSTEMYERTREHSAKFIGGVDPHEIIFTRGTTEAINLVMYTWGEENISEGDEILITEMEHHANLVPWVQLAKRKRAILKQIPITDEGLLDLSTLDQLITPRTKLVAVSHMSNVLGTINPVAEIAARAKPHGAIVLADGAQAAPHLPVNVPELGVDFYAFSAHKMVGPTGVGIFWGRRDLLESMPPFNLGGEMIREVRFDNVTWADIPNKFEGGTPDIANVVAFDAALSYLEEIGMDRIRAHEMALTQYAIEQIAAIPGIEIQGPKDVSLRGGAISFTDSDLHPHDISTFLDSRGIAIRAGHHCAQPLMRVMGKVATARASLYIYNDEADVDALVKGLREMRRYFGL